jgi:hypothetical protein
MCVLPQGIDAQRIARRDPKTIHIINFADEATPSGEGALSAMELSSMAPRGTPSHYRTGLTFH